MGLLGQMLRDSLNEKKSLTPEDFAKTYKSVTKDTKEWIKDETVEWLKKNNNHLPM